MNTGELIYKAFAPTLKILSTIGVGFALAKSGTFPPSAAKGVSIIALNVSIPALIWSSMVQAFNQDNISAFGGLALAAFLYQAIGAALAFIIREIFYVPMDYWWGIIVTGTLYNWGNMPTAVVQTIGAETPFGEGDVELGVAYIAVFILIFNISMFPLGLHKLCALDFAPDRPLEPIPVRKRWRTRIAWLKRRLKVSSSQEKESNDTMPLEPPSTVAIERKSDDHHGETDNEPSALDRQGSTAYRGGGVPARKTSRSTSFSSIRPIPPTAPLDAIGSNELCQSQSRQRHTRPPEPGEEQPSVLPVCATHDTPTYHQPLSPTPSIHQNMREIWLNRFKEFGKGILTPVSIAIVLAIPCALVQPIKALFTTVPGWTGGRMPNSPDGRPPLAWVLETATFIGGIVVPAGLLLLGAGFARLKGVMNFRGQPVAAMVAMAACKMVIVPVIGVFLVRGQPSIYPPQDTMLRFVCVLLSGTPAAANQLVITTLYNPEGTAHTLARFLLLQYILMPILSTALAAIAFSLWAWLRFATRLLPRCRCTFILADTMSHRRDVGRVVMDVAFFAASQVALYYALRYVLSSLDTSPRPNKKAQAKSRSALAESGLSDEQLVQLDLDEYEQTIAGEIIPPSSIDVTFESIGGLDEIIASLRETVIYPLTYPELFASTNGLLSAPKGVLLYGHPGCGKTMLAKALAKESGATFINLPLSSLTNKWFGESNKLVAGLFSLARKVQPSIIFIDEIDSLFRERSSGDHEVTAMMKAEFMTLWDGLTTGTDSRILVLGATNRPNDIDPAILRRMPKRFPIRLPNLEQRVKILSLMLSHTKLAPDFSVHDLARMTDGLSGSDLRETCRNAAMAPVREVMREKGANGKQGLEDAKREGFKLRPLNMSDFVLHDSHAYAHVDPSRRAPPGAWSEPVD